MKTKIKGLKYRADKVVRWLSGVIETNCFMFCLISAPVINLVIESLSRRSFFEGAAYLFQSPAAFLYNSLLVLVTLLAASLFKKRLFTVPFVQCLWVWMGVVNCVLLGFRVTPFGATDFLNIKSALDIVDIYMTPLELALAIGALALFLVGMAFLWLKAPKFRVAYRSGLMSLVLCAGLLTLSTHAAVSTNVISESFGNLAEAYDQYGFAYCFSKSLLDRGVDRPKEYSPEVMEALADDLTEETALPPAALENPNIIMIQLESFFDVNRLKNITFSDNPVPNFTRLLESNPSGLLTVPVIGAGTVNTEFEIISGMSLEYFGTGEYPYKTVLRSTVCPSICYDLGVYGYTSHAIHNNNGTFYDRHKVYPNLGFDTFISEEYMDNVRENPLGWLKDSILTQQVIKALDSTDGSDFVYTVSVQPHGKYPTELDYPTPFKVHGAEDSERRVQYQYYASQVYETDNFVASLLRALDSRGEPYIAVFYGDHLPSLGITDEDLSHGGSYQTEYVICTNTDLTTEGGDLYTYQLSAKVLEMAGLPGGMLTTLHQTYENEEEYRRSLELLEYDLLYGDKEVLGGQMPFEAKSMKMGVQEIKVLSAELKEDGLYVVGENITDKSHIFVGGQPFGETLRTGGGLLISGRLDIEDGDVITIVQMGSDGEPLSYSAEYIYRQT